MTTRVYGRGGDGTGTGAITSPYDPAATFEVGATASVLGLLFINKTAITIPETFDPGKWTCADRNLKTGVLSGGIISLNADPTKFDITAMTGIIVDNSDLDNYLVTPVSFPATTGIANINVSTSSLTHILIDVTGSVIQLDVRTVDDSLANLDLGRIGNSGGIGVIAVVETKTSYSTIKTTQALFASVGGQAIENVILTPGTTGLTLDASIGKILSQGRNFATDTDNPDLADIIIQTPIPSGRLFKSWVTNSGVDRSTDSSNNLIDPDNYNPLGNTLVATPAGKFTVQRMYSFGGSNAKTLYYGRTLYDTKDEALQSFDSSDEFMEHSGTFPAAFSAHIVVQQGITDWSDASTFEIINRAGGIGQSWDRGVPSGGIGGLTPVQKQSVLAGKSTGVFNGGELSGTVSGTIFNIAAGTGQVIDNTTPGTTTEDPYEWTAFTNITLTELGTSSKHTYIFLQKAGEVINIVQIGDISLITEVDRKNKLYLGVIRHGTGTFVGAISMPQTIASPVNKMIDLYIATGKTRSASGNQIVATGAGLLTLDKEIGKSYGVGINGFTDGNNTDFKDNPAITVAVMLKYSSEGHIDGATITNVDTARYDPNGAMIDAELVALGGGSTYVAHRIWIEAVNNTVIFQYGQASYASQDDAITNYLQENLSLPTGLNESSYLREVIIVISGAANLDSAVFIPISGGGGTSGTIMPTNIIDNLVSTDPNSALSANQGRVLDVKMTKTTGSVLFAGSTGAIDQDNANLFYDATTNDLGVGTAPTKGKIHAKQSGSTFDHGVTVEDVGGGTGRFYHTDQNSVALQKGTNTAQIELLDNGTVALASQIQVKGGAPALNKVLTSDATGLATWNSTIPKSPTAVGYHSAYSLRRVNAAYTGFLITVRRNSDDTLLGIGADDEDRLDEISLLAHVGSGGGFVQTLHDQSGNGRDLVQAVDADQARIVLSGVVNRVNNMPAMDFDGTSDNYTRATSAGELPTNEMSMFMVVQSDDDSVEGRMVVLAHTNEYFLILREDALADELSFFVTSAAGEFFTPYPYGVRNQITAISLSATTTELFLDGLSVGSGAAPWGAGTPTNIMVLGANRLANGTYAKMQFQELLIYTTNKNTERLDIEGSQNDYWFPAIAGAAVGADMLLHINGGADTTIVGGAANVSNTNLNLNDARTLNILSHPFLITAGAGSGLNPLMLFDPGVKALINYAGNNLEINGTGIELGFVATSDLKINNSAGLANQVLTSNGPSLPPTWETSSGGLASDSYLSINSNALTPFHTFTLSTSTAGFGNNYNVLDLIQTNLQRTIDPSGMLQANNTCVIQTAGVYEIFWSVSDDVGTQTYVHIRANGVILSSGHSGSDTGGSGMVTSTVASLIVGDVIEFATSLTSDTDMKRPNVKINQIR